MKVLVDTCIWSLAFRRSKKNTVSPEIKELTELINEGRVCMIGPVRQEILSGIREEEQYIGLKNALASFPDVPLITADYELAAEFFNTLQQKGVQGSNTDFLICATANRLNAAIFTIDKDFPQFKTYTDIVLHNPRADYL